MKLDISKVEYVAKLARLNLTAEEKELYSTQLTGILDYAEKLSAVKTDKVVPTYHVCEVRNILRSDEAIHRESNPSLLQNAPDKKGNFLKVPKIIDV